jgi:branched-chain amino acid transport system permease protein
MIFRPNGLLGGVNFTDMVLRALGRKPNLNNVIEQQKRK